MDSNSIHHIGLTYARGFGGQAEQGRKAFDEYMSMRPDDTPLKAFADRLHGAETTGSN